MFSNLYEIFSLLTSPTQFSIKGGGVSHMKKFVLREHTVALRWAHRISCTAKYSSIDVDWELRTSWSSTWFLLLCLSLWCCILAISIACSNLSSSSIRCNSSVAPYVLGIFGALTSNTGDSTVLNNENTGLGMTAHRFTHNRLALYSRPPNCHKIQWFVFNDNGWLANWNLRFSIGGKVLYSCINNLLVWVTNLTDVFYPW